MRTPALPDVLSLSGSLALTRLLGFRSSLDQRTRLLVSRLAAELSGCSWCIERCGHDWRNARLPSILLRHVRDPDSITEFTDRDRAALAFGTAVIQAGVDGATLPTAVIRDARRFFSQEEIAELARCIADHHCLDDPGT